MNSLFNINRFGLVAKWSLKNDRGYMRKQILMLFATLVVFALIFSLDHKNDERTVMMMLTSVLLTIMVMGGFYMYTAFHERPDSMRDLLMLPASNLEKFLARYLVAYVPVLLASVVSIALADGLHYAVGLLIGREGVGFLLPGVLQMTFSALSNPCVLLLIVWSNTFFMLGSNFFRNLKYGWVPTAMVMIVICIVCVAAIPEDYLMALLHTDGKYDTLRQELSNYIAAVIVVLPVLSLLNVWLAYRLFCRRQLIGKYINL